MKRRFLIESVFWGIGILGAWLMAVHLQSRAAQTWRTAGEVLAFEMLAPWVESACREGNDPQLARFVARAAWTPGVRSILLKGPEGTFRYSSLSSPRDLSCPAQLLGVEWATPAHREAARKQQAASGLFAALILISAGLRLGWEVRKSMRWATRHEEASRLVRALEQDAARLRGRANVAQEALRLGLQRALVHDPGKTLYLDEHQRLIAASPSIQPASAGASWQEIPMIAQAGEAIAQSLESPDRPVLALGGGPRPTLEIESLVSSQGTIILTRIASRSPL